MRRAICFLLILTFCLSLACPAMAVRHPSAGNDGKPPFGPDHRGDTDRPEGPHGPNRLSSTPKTGDQIMMYVIMMVVSLVALVVLIVLFYKKYGK